MASVAESFLDDLDDLSGDSGVEEEEEPQLLQHVNAASRGGKRKRGDNADDEDDDESDGDDALMEASEETDAAAAREEARRLAGIQEAAAQGKGLAAVAQLKRSPQYLEHVETIRGFVDRGSSQAIDPEALAEGSAEYQLVVTSNDLMVQIDDEIAAIHRFIAELYAPKFPELDALVPNALDYARVVQAIGNEMDLTLVDLSRLLPSAAVISISVTGSATSGRPLEEPALGMCLEACAELLSLHEDKQMILGFVERRMSFLAPNVTQLVGTRIAAQLVGLAGGVAALARIPACNLQVLGQQRKVLSGFSSAAALKHTGIIFYSDLVQGVPPYLRMKACRALAGKLALMARVDSQPHAAALTASAAGTPDGVSAAGETGRRFRAELVAKFAKWEEPQKAKTKKALPIPDEKPRRKRGGKRYRKMKERLQMTDVRRELNRQTFATADDEYGDNAMGRSLGRLGQEGSGVLRITRKEQRQSTKKLRQASVALAKSVAAASVPLSGLASSLAFTPVQGIELVNPEAAKKRVEEANKKYFAATSGFVSVVKKSGTT